MSWSFSGERPESWDVRGSHKFLEDTVWSRLWCTVTPILLAGGQDEMTLWSHSPHSSFTEQRKVHINIQQAEDKALPGISRLLIYIPSHSFHAIHSLPVHLLFFLLTDVVDGCTSKTQRIIQIISLGYMYNNIPNHHSYFIHTCITDLLVKPESHIIVKYWHYQSY